jgi:soluble lytic murein transglycosylase-like protein
LGTLGQDSFDQTLRYLFNLDMVKLSKRVKGFLHGRLIGLTPLAVLLIGEPFHAQEIVTLTSKDGRIIYANTEDPAPSADNPIATAGIGKTQKTLADAPAAEAIDGMIDRISEQQGVDPELVRAVARVESNYNPRAVSSRGALGVMQLRPETAKRFGVVNVWDPSQNIEGGVKFLKFLSGMFPNNLPYVLAAYNAGENAVVKHRGIPPFPETRAYVRRITGIYKKGTILTAENEPSGIIVSYRDEAGRVVYSNLETAYR